MKKLKYFVLVGFVVMLFTGCFEKEISINPKGVLSGVVVDQEGIPIKGVRVIVGDKTVETGTNGDFVVKDIEAGGDPKYYAVFVKANYIATSAEANFKSGLTVSSSGSVDGLPLDNSAASLKVVMTEVVTLKGKLKLPKNYTESQYSKIKVVPEIEISENYKKFVPKSGYKNEISNSLDFIIKDVPKFGMETTTSGGSIIKSIKFKVYTNDKEWADFYYVENSTGVLNIESKSKEYAAQNRVDIGSFDLEKYLSIKGHVYKNYQKNQSEKITGASISLKTNNTEIKSVNSDTDGAYRISEIEVGKEYEVILKNLDKNGDGRPELTSKYLFDKISGFAEKNEVEKDLWYDGECAYTVKGKVYFGKKSDDTTAGGIKVNLISEGKLIDTIKTDSIGSFKFENVPYTNITLAAEDIDVNNNGVADFIGYTEGSSIGADAKKDITNTSNINVENIDLILGINTTEPAFKLALNETNFAEKGSDNKFTSIDNAITPDGNIVLEFSNEITKSAIEYVEKKGRKPFKVLAKDNGKEVNSSYSFVTENGVESKKKIKIQPLEYLTKGNYRLEIDKEISSINGEKYVTGNDINSQISNVDILVDIADVNLAIASTNFTTKLSDGTFVTQENINVDDNMTITFANSISESIYKGLIASGENIITINDGTNTIPCGFELSSDKKTVTINPASNLKAGVEYTIVLNSKLKSEQAEKFGIASTTSFTVKGKVVKTVNTVLSAIKPTISTWYAINSVDYPLNNFSVDWNLNGAIYKSVNKDSVDYLDSGVKIENGVNGVSDYGISDFPIEFPISAEIIDTNLREIKNVTEFRIYGKTSAPSSYWTVLKTIKVADISKQEIAAGKTKAIYISLKNIAGLNIVDRLSFGTIVSVIVVPVDLKGKQAEFDEINKLEIKDTYAPKIESTTTPTGKYILEPGVNTVNISESIDSSKAYDVVIAGVNENLKYRIDNKKILDFSRVGFEVALLSSGIKTNSEFNYLTATEISSGVYEIGVNKIDGLYENMILESESDSTKKIVVKKIVGKEKIYFSFVSSKSNIAANTFFKPSSDNSDIFDRSGVNTSIQYLASAGLIIKSGVINIESITGATIKVSSVQNSQNPLLGYKVGDELVFEKTSTSQTIKVLIKEKAADGKSFVTNSDTSGLNGSFYTNCKVQISGMSNAVSFPINEKVIMRKFGLADKDVYITEVDTSNNLAAISEDATAYTGGTAILKSVQEKSLILQSKEKIMIGDYIVINKAGTTNGNLELKVTGITPVDKQNGTWTYKYDVEGTDIAKVQTLFQKLLSGEIDNIKVEYKPMFTIKASLIDTSGNSIQQDNDELFYDIYNSYPAWNTK